MMQSDIRAVLIGYGNIALKHLEVFHALGVHFSAACNRSEAMRQKARVEGGIERSYDNHLRMIEQEKPDAIIITASVLSQYRLTREIIPFGVPILLEKPPGVSFLEANELAELARKHGTKVMVGLNRRFYSIYHDSLAAMGGRQAITGVSVEWSEDPVKMKNSGHPDALLSLLNFANSLHGIDLLFLFGGIIRDFQVLGRNLDPSGDSHRWQMSLQGISETGAITLFNSNWDVPGRWRLIVDAPDVRMVSAPLETAAIFRTGRPKIDIIPSLEDQKFKPGFYLQAKTFVEVVRDDRPIQWPACSLGDVLPEMKMAEQLTDACIHGKTSQ
jgi:predicted dehydrogenase